MSLTSRRSTSARHRAQWGAPAAGEQPRYGDEEYRWEFWKKNHSFREFTAVQNLQVYEFITAVFHGAQCFCILVAIVKYNATRKVPLSIPYVTWPGRHSADKNFGYGSYEDGHIDLAWCVFGFFLLSFVFQLAAVLLWRKTASCLLDYYIQPFRWFEYSISASLMAIIFGALNGISETTFLYNMFLSFFTTMMLGLIQELSMSIFKRMQFRNDESKLLLRETFGYTNEPAGNTTFGAFADTDDKKVSEDIQHYLNILPAEPDRRLNTRWMVLFLPHMLGWVPFLGVVSVFMTTFSLAVSNSPESPPAWVYFLYSFQFVVMSLFAVVQIVEQLYIYWAPQTEEGKLLCRRYAVRSEFAYTTLSLVAKSVLGWVVYSNVLVEKQIGFAGDATPVRSF